MLEQRYVKNLFFLNIILTIEKKSLYLWIVYDDKDGVVIRLE